MMNDILDSPQPCYAVVWVNWRKLDDSIDGAPHGAKGGGVAVSDNETAATGRAVELTKRLGMDRSALVVRRGSKGQWTAVDSYHSTQEAMDASMDLAIKGDERLPVLTDKNGTELFNPNLKGNDNASADEPSDEPADERPANNGDDAGRPA